MGLNKKSDLDNKSYKVNNERYWKEQRGMWRLNRRMVDDVWDDEILTEMYWYTIQQSRICPFKGRRTK